MHEATVQWKQTGQPARVFTEFLISDEEDEEGRSGRRRRVAAKAEHIDGKENPRFVVTSLTNEPWPAQALYSELYCERGDMENRIEEQFSLFADRVSAETIRGNEMRLYLSAMAYILVSGLRRLGLQAPNWRKRRFPPSEPSYLRSARRSGFRFARSGFRWHPVIHGKAFTTGLVEPSLLKPDLFT